jgi:hypothetical protein
MTTYGNDKEEDKHYATGPMPGRTEYMIQRDKIRAERNRFETRQKKLAVDTYVQQHAAKSVDGKEKTEWTFDKLEKEVKENSPYTKNIVKKREIYKSYLEATLKSNNGTYSEYAQETLKKFDQETAKLQAKTTKLKVSELKSGASAMFDRFSKFISTSKTEVKGNASQSSPDSSAQSKTSSKSQVRE